MTGVIGRFGLVLAAASLLAGCQDEGGLFKKKSTTEGAPAVAGAAAGAAPARSVKLVDRDVEAPEVFQANDTALWDGRPSLGGVWVASPSATDPERVIIRNSTNGKFVIGALFRRERDNPGPKLQISSDAAAALGVLAGQPAKITVTALRREETPAAAPDASKPILDANEGIEAKPLDTAAVATAALDRADGKKGATPPAPNVPKATPKAVPTMTPETVGATAPAATKPAAPAKAGSGGLIQVGIFSVEANAKRASDALSKAGIAADTRKGEAQGKAFWQVTARGGADTMAKVKAAGFADAYVLKR